MTTTTIQTTTETTTTTVASERQTTGSTTLQLVCETGWTMFELGGGNHCWKFFCSLKGSDAFAKCADLGARVPLPNRLGHSAQTFLFLGPIWFSADFDLKIARMKILSCKILRVLSASLSSGLVLATQVKVQQNPWASTVLYILVHFPSNFSSRCSRVKQC